MDVPHGTTPLGEICGSYAGFASRLAAYMVDLGILSLVQIVLVWATVVLMRSLGVDLTDCDALTAVRPVKGWICHGVLWLTPFTAMGLTILYGLFFWSTTGQSPGKRVAGVRIVRLDGRPMTLWTALRRLAGFAVSVFAVGLGFLPILVDDRRQAFHDKVAGTCVLYSWSRGGR